jgi:hypothetical protein
VTDVVHMFSAVNSQAAGKGTRKVTATTFCRQDLSIKSAEDETLQDVGLTAWYSDVTCEPCLARIEHRTPATQE